MSLSRPLREHGSGIVGSVDVAPLRAAALGAGLVLTASYLWVLASITDVVGGTGTLLAVAFAALFAGTALARLCAVRTALAVGLVAFLGGIGAYVLAVPEGLVGSVSVGSLARDALALLTGLSILRMVAAGTWAISVTPAPVFLSWYLLCRRRYAVGAAVGLGTLSVFVLTGDAPLLVATVGVLGGVAAVGFGELERRGASVARSDALVVALSAMLIATLSITAVPGGVGEAGGPLAPTGQAQALDGSLVGTDEQVTIVGSIELSPEVHFVVESDEPAYWRTDAYDRYTGSTWVQSGEPTAYEGGELDGPPGESETVSQAVRAETDIAALPAAWQPVVLEGSAADGASVGPHDGFQPATPVSEGESYTVESERPTPSETTLEGAGTDYPDEVEERYTQLPDSTPDRVGEYADELTADADSPYEQALITERHLSSEWEYSLDVDRPEGDVADATLFGMDAAYCTYFATTMVTMLRSQDVPARFVVGYTEGEAVDDDRYAVRGLDAHAWVEVYFPKVGWVEFDPTPPERDSVHEDRLDDARDAGDPDVDTQRTEPDEESDAEADEDDGADGIDAPDDENGDDEPAETEAMPETGQPAPDRGAISSSTEPIDDPAFEAQQDESERLTGVEDEEPGLAPSRELLAVLGALVVGLVAGAHRIDAPRRLHGLLAGRSRDRTPEATTERAYERLERMLASDYRARRPGESPRQYVEALSLVGADERVRRVAALYERARYGPGVSEAEAEEARSLVARVNRDRSVRERLGAYVRQ